MRRKKIHRNLHRTKKLAQILQISKRTPGSEVVAVAEEAVPSVEEAPTQVDLDAADEAVKVTPSVEEESGPEDKTKYGADEEQPNSAPYDELIQNLDETVAADSELPIRTRACSVRCPH
jgi:hypothetical protein